MAAPQSPTRSGRASSRPPVSSHTGGGNFKAGLMGEVLHQQGVDHRMRIADMGGDAYSRTMIGVHVDIAKRPGFVASGAKDAKVNINCFKVVSYPSKVVYQYDVTIGTGIEKRGLNMAVWESKRVTKALGPGWIYDGVKLAWALSDKIPINPIQLPSGGGMESQGAHWTTIVDLDAEKNKSPGKKSNAHRIQLRCTKKLDLYALQSYLKKESDFNDRVLECMSFIDHLMRAGPSKYLLAIKRSFYANTVKPGYHVGQQIYAYKGVYQAARIAQSGDQQGYGHLVVNADVNNICFWGPNVTLLSVASELCSTSHDQLVHALTPRVIGGKRIDDESPAMRQVNRLRRVRFTVKYNNMPASVQGKTFTVDKIIAESPETYTFDHVDIATGNKKKVTMAQYFWKTYQQTFKYAGAIVLTPKGTAYPLEICHIVPGQRYPFKLDEGQTSHMIKFAVTKPDVRAADIMTGVKSLNWTEDNYLRHFGMSVDTKMLTSKAKLLAPPILEFGRKKIVDPKTFGQWKIEGQTFIEPNKKPLQHWGVMQLNQFGRANNIADGAIQQFMDMTISEYLKYGGQVTNKKPIIMNGSNQDLGKAVENLYTAIASKCKPGESPQLLVFIVNGKTKESYDRLKKSCDCRFGVVSQVLQAANVVRCQTQYIGNVLMKVNAKLGGFTAHVLPNGAAAKVGTSATHFNGPTMMIGADVSHPGPGGLGVSMAAVAVSMDKFGGKYSANCESNGHRIEAIAPWNWKNLVRPLLIQWLVKFQGKVPAHIIYIRDGVSEGQYQVILQQELRDLKAVWEEIPKLDKAAVSNIKYTVIIASKRHHIRMFPADQNKDKNNNVLPGTLVERDVTTARDWDFYLTAHKAIQGTSRPVHYAVIRDEMKCKPEYLIKLIYDQCYQYVRSTTSVSIHPAVYYAHLAARRAVAHERDPHGFGRGGTHKPSEESERAKLEEEKLLADHTGKKLTETALQRLQYLTEASYPCLISLKNDHKIMETMWYV